MRTRSTSLLMFTVLTLLSGCEDEKTTQAIVPVNEETTLDSGERKETEVPLIVPSPITNEIEEQMDSHAKTIFPTELVGAWDVSVAKCQAIKTNDSDTRIEIQTKIIQGYEEHRDLVSIQRVSNSPSAWRVYSKSNIAPAEAQKDAQIFILNGGEVVISDGANTHKLVRCE